MFLFKLIGTLGPRPPLGICADSTRAVLVISDCCMTFVALPLCES